MPTPKQKTLQNGDIRWEIQIRKKGYKPVYRVRRTKAAVLKAYNAVITAMENGTWDEFAVAEQKQGNTILQSFIELYLAKVTPKKKGGQATVEFETSALNQVLNHKIAKMDVYKIKKGHIIDLRDTWTENGNKDNSINRKLTVLQDVFKQIGERWHHDTLINPVVGTKLPMPVGGDQRNTALDADEMEALRTALSECNSPYVRWIFDLAIETAARRRELFENTWNNVNFNNGELTIPAPIAKTRLERAITLTPNAIAILKAMKNYQNPNPLDTLIPITLSSFIQSWKRAIKRSKVKDFQFRDSRHMAITMLSRIYPRCQDLARLTGHERLDTLLRYYEDGPKERRIQMDAYYAKQDRANIEIQP